jgi:hypothetical protein
MPGARGAYGEAEFDQFADSEAARRETLRFTSR